MPGVKATRSTGLAIVGDILRSYAAIYAAAAAGGLAGDAG